MNFLAHSHLSPLTEPYTLIGNTLGDFIKSPRKINIPIEVRQGVYLHRAIDTYTDTHADVRQARSLIFKEYRHYSRVLIDIYYDHFLAKYFNDYSDLDLAIYSKAVYCIFNTNKDKLPQAAREVAYAMEAGNWLLGYKSLSGIDLTCRNMAKRAGGRAQILATGAIALENNYAQLENTFRKFYPQLQHMAKSWLHNAYEK